MASSIHIAKGHSGSVAHNSRHTPTKNAIFSDELNECSHSTKEAFSIYRDELQLRTVAYTQNTGQKLQSKAITHLSAVVNLEQHHTLKDLEALKKHLEDTLDTVVFQVAIHRDEGHVNEELKDVKNYHAHIEFMGLDTEGKSVRKKLTKKYLSDLQTVTANILGMERGRNYAKERAPRPKRLDTYEYKEYKQREAKEIKSKVATIAELKETIKELRAELKENKAVRSDYAALEQLNKELKAKVESKDLTIQELETTKKSHVKAFREILPTAKNEVEVVEYVKTLKNELQTTKRLKDKLDHTKTLLSVSERDMRVLNTSLIDSRREVQELEQILPEEKRSIFIPLKDRFLGFIKELKETIKAQAIKILNLETENQNLLRENRELELEVKQLKLSPKQQEKETAEDILNSEEYKSNLSLIEAFNAECEEKYSDANSDTELK